MPNRKPPTPSSYQDTSTPSLCSFAASRLREALHASASTRAQHLRVVADVLIELRSRYEHDGMPDWSGKSFEYRTLVRDMYAEAGLPPDGQSAIKAALRYHVGNALRDRLSPDELANVGLVQAAPRARHYDRVMSASKPADRASDLVVSIAASVARLADMDEETARALTSEDVRRLRAAQNALRRWLTKHGDVVEQHFDEWLGRH